MGNGIDFQKSLRLGIEAIVKYNSVVLFTGKLPFSAMCDMKEGGDGQ